MENAQPKNKQEKQAAGFPLSSLQQGYLFGTQSAFDLHVATHTYYEFRLDSIDESRFQQALNILIQRHDALRAVINDDGNISVLTDIPPYTVTIDDLRALDSGQTQDRLAKTRHHFERANLDFHRWPCFEFRITRMSDCDHMHANFTPMFTDGVSVSRLLHELSLLYSGAALTPATSAFRYADYAWYREQQRQSTAFEKARAYWWQRLDSLPGGPELPVLEGRLHATRSRLVRRRVYIEEPHWQALKDNIAHFALKPTAVLLTLYAATIAHWSKTSHFCLTMLVQNRDRNFPDTEQAVASFASTVLVEVDFSQSRNFIGQVQQVQRQLFMDLMHAKICGLEILQERNREQHSMARAGSPVAFVSNLEARPDSRWENDLFHRNGRNLVHSSLETPQVYLDHQIAETQDNQLAINWDAMDEILPGGLADEMLATYHDLILTFARSQAQWQQPLRLDLPDRQQQLIDASNQTRVEFPKPLLHELFLEQQNHYADCPAVQAHDRTLTYRELAAYSQYVRERLEDSVAPNDLVAVFMHKGWQQIPAALGTTWSGAAYVPIDPGLPGNRIEYLFDTCNIRHVLTQNDYTQRPELQNLNIITLPDSLEETTLLSTDSNTARQDMADLAYVIFTSGSTGLPKGVMLNHEGPVNTILDINQKFAITESDRIFAISALSFDLSVYDLFGTLAAGGCIVIPDVTHLRDPSHWLDVLEEHQVTVWNSAPALMQMLVEYTQQTQRTLPASLRVIMMSGDWIPTWLPEAIHAQRPDISIYSLGGATEASIWSIYYPIRQVDKNWRSIPYGKALANQTMHVFDKHMQPRPFGVPGDIYIGGVGLAMGYWKNKDITDAAFVTHPLSGDRFYRTGDLGRYMSDGNIEFLGREDSQIKLQGYRVELGEIESILLQHEQVHHAVVMMHGDDHANRRLIAYVATGQSDISNEDIVRFASAQLPPYMVPAYFVLLEQLPVTVNGKIDRKHLPLPEQMQSSTHTSRPPAGETEMALAGIWIDVLDLNDTVSATASFFDLGGQSFLSVRLMLQIQNHFGITLPLATLIEADTIEKLAQRIDEHNQCDKPQADTPLVLLQKGQQHHPVFLIHPVGGNVLCYRGLVTHLKKMQTDFYGLQSFTGLAEEHNRLNLTEMAERYVDAIKDIHNGPFNIGGWSMGGVVASEMARQLVAQNETVAHLFMFDSPAPLVHTLPSEQDCLHWFFRDLLADDTDWLTEYMNSHADFNLRALLEFVIQQNRVAPGTQVEQLENIYQTFIHNLTALTEYQPTTIQSVEKLLLLRAADTPISELQRHPAAQQPDWGWSRYLDESLESVTIKSTPGDHYTIFNGQNLIQLTSTFSEWYRSE